MTKIKVAAVQMRSSTRAADNLAAIEGYVAEAAAAGVRYVQTPEMSVAFSANKDGLIAVAEPFEGNKAIAVLRETARRNGVTVHIGSMVVALGDGKFANRSVLINAWGEIVAHYDKIHLFDADPDNDRSYHESATYSGGERAVVCDVEGARFGLSVCYDMRFAHLYRVLANAGAQVLAVPSAFTVLTGLAHWELLLRARAVENCCFVIAAAQGGLHENGRQTYGHSLITGPWGDIIAKANSDEPGLVVAEIDLDEIDRVRKKVPGLANQRSFIEPAKA